MAQLRYLELWIKWENGTLDCAILPPGCTRGRLYGQLRRMVLPRGVERVDFVGLKIMPEEKTLFRGVKKDGQWTWTEVEPWHVTPEGRFRLGPRPDYEATGQEVLV